jgi:hypothetical protein
MPQTDPAAPLTDVPFTFSMGMAVRRLVDFPYVLVRLRCDACKRAGVPTGWLGLRWAEVLLDDLLVRLSLPMAR